MLITKNNNLAVIRKHGRYTSKIVVKGEYILSILQVKLLKELGLKVTF